ncbi:hypothetical protein CJO75_09285 [Ralstonia solanacearum]|nr:hypothetical protein RSOE_15755 [Ralstonia solanacearum OE1-1]AXV73709.1 hypothetical protein CJO75_09285 [Ralstonia solanacearum]TXD87552.1 hypothetical protein FUT89_14140 [Ralstonia pseudosolanacearum]AXW15061.1 hypothetical protein CJO84_09250 [Ralstonia solanacearum]AXW38485.1 hypothetical protein CJO89_09320 [Ralstonia solanacearum]
MTDISAAIRWPPTIPDGRLVATAVHRRDRQAYDRLPPGRRSSPVLIEGSGSRPRCLAPARIYISDFLLSVLEST